ncbi:cornifelin homolog A-like [Salvelinus sp. IW2-2015]|uniref:cornifelin homolog A-like n=1 Tax=Salvelinus sp. IW2-2015 TaxID=2691554 RepID=UPI000CDFD9EA|nr:cornifelin homolog A-like [Salvelinus alpinus]XP_041701117.1 cornifelin homolog A-like [Coregonus clupeaformis]
MEKKEACKSGYGVCDRAVMSQPNTPAKWNSRILDCCIDRRVCLCGTFCSMCLACQMAERYGECFCLPLLPTTMMMMRTSMRERYNIPGSLIDDWAVHMFCGPCALCQMAREMKHQLG